MTGLHQNGRSLVARTGAFLARDPLLNVLSLVGYAWAIFVAIEFVTLDGGSGRDSHAYWLAGRAWVDRTPLYFQSAIEAYGAFKYPPVFAMLMVPVALVPALAWDWIWRGFMVVCVRYLAGSWRGVGIWFLVPIVLIELAIGNVTFLLAAACFAALREGRAAWSLVAMAALKFGPAWVIPYVWIDRPPTRRPIVAGAIGFAALCGLSYVLWPASWELYIQSFSWQTGLTTLFDLTGLLAVFPTVGTDFIFRAVIASLLVLYGIRVRSERAPFIAAVITVPALAVWRLAPLLALPRLAGAQRPILSRRTSATEPDRPPA